MEAYVRGMLVDLHGQACFFVVRSCRQAQIVILFIWHVTAGLIQSGSSVDMIRQIRQFSLLACVM